MAGETSSTKGLLMEFPTPILSKISGDPTRESLIKFTFDDHWKCGVRRVKPQRRTARTPHTHNDHIVLHGIYGLHVCATEKTSYYPPTMGTTQEQLLVTERFQQNQALFRRCTAVDGEI